MTYLYSFIRGSLEWLISELFLSDASLWNQHKFITFNIFLFNILIIYWKILIITATPKETTHELTICAKLCLNIICLKTQMSNIQMKQTHKFPNFSIKLQLTWFFKRMLLSIGIINFKIESLIDENIYTTWNNLYQTCATCQS